MTDSEISKADKLAEPFPQRMLKHHAGKGLTYVPVSEVIAKLNRVLGTDNWSYEVLRLWETGAVETDTGTYPKWVMAHVRLRALVDFNESIKDGIGGQEVKFLKKRGDSVNPPGVVDLGDEYKGAMSDALKKAAQGLGVGLELAREDDAIEYERNEKEPKANTETCDRIAAAIKALDEDEGKSFKEWWAANVGKKLASGQVTVAEAEKALVKLGVQ